MFRALLAKNPASDPALAVRLWAGLFGNPLTWDDLPWFTCCAAFSPKRT